MKNKIEFIAFDADDTLWENELYFQELPRGEWSMAKTKDSFVSL